PPGDPCRLRTSSREPGAARPALGGPGAGGLRRRPRPRADPLRRARRGTVRHADRPLRRGRDRGRGRPRARQDRISRRRGHPRGRRGAARRADGRVLDRGARLRRRRRGGRTGGGRRGRRRDGAGGVMAGRHPAVARARTAVSAALSARLELLADETAVGRTAPRLLVGVSGGADSLALLATTVWVGSRMGLETEAGIVDHGLQEGSAGVAERALVQAERLGAEARILRVAVDAEAPGGIENAARTARHRALGALAEERGALALLMAHTLDDQAEQVLVGLARGGGPRALAGIPRARGPLLRPFLGSGRDESTALRRADTEEICRLHDLEWWEDPMNADETLDRKSTRLNS